jgi:hypothetical protein
VPACHRARLTACLRDAQGVTTMLMTKIPFFREARARQRLMRTSRG